MRRRDFISETGRLATFAAAASFAPAKQQQALIVADPRGRIENAKPARWAVQNLERTLQGAGWSVARADKPQQGSLNLVVAGPDSRFASRGMSLAPESHALLEADVNGVRCLVASGADSRGCVYAICEIADRVRHGIPLRVREPILESPANRVRSVMRQFTSELLDKPWFYDRESWTEYLDLLASQRWNRVDLAFGLGYDNLNRVDDSYFLFFYPFVVAVPGYDVRVTMLPDAERQRNLEMLQFISEQTVDRGMDFQLGIWMHGYHWPKGTARYITEGLTPETHAPYCRDALTTVLQKCPAISSVGLRIHGESGIAEGSYDFWATIFDGVRRCGRTVEIDLHAKGIDNKMIDNALATGMPVNVSPKFSAEHFGMPYHQAAIREMEMPVAGHIGRGLMTLSEGARVFTRYGYADLMREDRRYTIRHRVFSGTQRLLLWDDPVSTAAYGRAFQFCGSKGADLMEPLTCRGRRGSAKPGTRTGYADVHMEPACDWQKYREWYRVWGRLLYNPATSADVVRRPANAHLDSALSNASRILPIVTMAYMPSAACDAYWPEIYWNQPIVSEARNNPYGDTLAPKVFQNASPLDPELFSGMNECANELLSGQRSGKYTPLEVAQWLEHFAAEAENGLKAVTDSQPPEIERALIDTRIQAGIGRFFAQKFRAGVLYAIYEQTSDQRALAEALRCYRASRNSWAGVAALSSKTYTADLSVSDRFDERGQWADRLAMIDEDIAALQAKNTVTTAQTGNAEHAIQEVLHPTPRMRWECRHVNPSRFRRGSALSMELKVLGTHTPNLVMLRYRHVDQSQRYQAIAMQAAENGFRTEIPAAYTDSPYPLQYYFELRQSSTRVSLYPGFGDDPVNQPYFVVRQSASLADI